MIVCICKKVSNRSIWSLKKAGYTFEEIRELTKLGSQCGKCLKLAEYEYQEAIDVQNL